MKRRRLRRVVGVGVVAMLAGAVFGWWVKHTSREAFGTVSVVDK